MKKIVAAVGLVAAAAVLVAGAGAVLVASANDELSQPLCRGTTAPLTSPCPFLPGAPISAHYRSTDNGASWTGGYLPGFDTIGRASGGDPSLDVGPRRCKSGAFAYRC